MSEAYQFGVKLAGLASATARGMHRGIESYNQDAADRGEPEISDDAQAMLALALGSGVLALRYGPGLLARSQSRGQQYRQRY